MPDIEGTTRLMLGNNVPDAYTPFEVATGSTGSPHATRSSVEWTIWNLSRSDEEIESFSIVNRAQMTANCDLQESSNLDQLVETSVYVFPEILIDKNRDNSIDDKYFLEQENESVGFEKGHYYITLMIRNQDVKIPKQSQGLQRVNGFQSTMTKNPKFKDDSVAFMYCLGPVRPR